jgi:hypothetical protein
MSDRADPAATESLEPGEERGLGQIVGLWTTGFLPSGRARTDLST